MANNKTWLLVTGRCHRQPTDYQQAHLSHWYHALGVITKAFVAPLAWVIIGFIDGQFYQCAASEDPCGGSDKVFLMSKSQMIGYVILMVSMSTAIFGMLLWRASRPMSYEQDNYINIYRTIERMEIHRQFEAHAQAVAHQNVKEFLAKESRPKKDWDYIAHVPSITPTTGPRGMDGAPPSMSPLNKLVQKERRESMESNGVLAPRLGLVGIDNHALHTQCSGEDVPLGELKIEHGSGSVA